MAKARAVALPELVPLLAEQATPEWMQIWNSFFPDQLFEKPTVPVALDKPELDVEGHTLPVLKLGQSDVADSTPVHVRDLDALLPGDVIYNDIQVVSKMTAKYPDLGNPYTLWLAAYTQSYGD